MNETKISDEMVGSGCACTCSTVADEMLRQGEEKPAGCGGGCPCSSTADGLSRKTALRERNDNA